MSQGSKLHSGHRARMRKRFTSSGRSFGSFSEHEVLEMLLFNCYKRQNTNEIAHDLINRFGSLINVLTAPIDELCRVKNINKAVAANIRFYGELYMYLLRGGEDTADIGDIGFMKQYLASALKTFGHGLYVVTQDEKGRLKLHCCCSDLFPVKMQILTARSERVASVEYIPDEPSESDPSVAALIDELSGFCAANGIEHCDHYIFGRGRIVSLKERDMF